MKDKEKNKKKPVQLVGDSDGDILSKKPSKELSDFTVERSECGWNLMPKTKEGAVLLQAQIDMLGRFSNW